MTKLAVHKTFESINDKRQVVLRVSNGKKVDLISGDTKLENWLNSVKRTDELRFTAVHAQDPILKDLTDKGVQIKYANWHKTGIAKDLSPDDIVKQFAVLPEETFRVFTPRPELAELRRRVSDRLAILEYRKAMVLKLRGSARLFGQVEENDLSDEVAKLVKEAEEIDVRVPVVEKGKEKMVSIDTIITKLAKKIPECDVFNSVAHLEAYGTAAAVAAFSGGIDRFDNVASFWHYCGQDPTSNKRKKGQPLSFNPKLKTILWQMSESIIKNRNNPWRDYYDMELTRELEVHQQKYPGCKTRDGRICGTKEAPGHCMAMAKVKMRKEILKRFFLACKGEEYSDSRRGRENQGRIAIA